MLWVCAQMGVFSSFCVKAHLSLLNFPGDTETKANDSAPYLPLVVNFIGGDLIHFEKVYSRWCGPAFLKPVASSCVSQWLVLNGDARL